MTQRASGGMEWIHLAQDEVIAKTATAFRLHKALGTFSDWRRDSTTQVHGDTKGNDNNVCPSVPKKWRDETLLPIKGTI
jgi:hypothetical protein